MSNMAKLHRYCCRKESQSTFTVPFYLRPQKNSTWTRVIRRIIMRAPRCVWSSRQLDSTFVPAAPPGRHADGNGLSLYVQPTGTRSWVQCLVIRGRRRELGLGSARLVSLAEAREQALANRKLARSGGDPLAERRRAQGIPTFAEVLSS